jgi:hypothetical protein
MPETNLLAEDDPFLTVKVRLLVQFGGDDVDV